MRIGEFITLLNTTKDTIRHYEELNLLTPIRKGNYREYGEKDILDFQVIVELKSMGLSLKDIQLLFELKKALGCGDHMLVKEVYHQLKNHVEKFRQEEEEIYHRRTQLQQEVEKLRAFL
ncbi:MerR family transcriptional regulator [Ferdinandcohnia quinoae]|uniref:MerR family transcriptional regulator n=1 Tax=Fredinandcohnia quinoae TaxID=2918902 RepID=A0AAW5E7T7_9BACI|nr:MerR family transcriptional regulator [Fredinandcohnia sp. SECRCQ15]